MPIAELLPLLIQILSAAPAVVNEVKQIWDMANSSTPTTPDQEAEIQAALDAAHAALQQS